MLCACLSFCGSSCWSSEPEERGAKHGFERLTICDPQPVLELVLDAEPVEPDVDLRPAAMHEDGLHAHTC